MIYPENFQCFTRVGESQLTVAMWFDFIIIGEKFPLKGCVCVFILQNRSTALFPCMILNQTTPKFSVGLRSFTSPSTQAGIELEPSVSPACAPTTKLRPKCWYEVALLHTLLTIFNVRFMAPLLACLGKKTQH